MGDESVEVHNIGFMQNVFRGFLRCLGLKSEGGGAADAENEVTKNSLSSPVVASTTSTTYDPIPSSYDASVVSPVVKIHPSSANDSPITTPLEVSNDDSTKTSFTMVTIDEMINDLAGTTTTRYVDLLDSTQNNTSLLTTRLISSGGGGQTH